MSEDLEQSMPLVLLMGVESEGVVSALNPTGRQYKKKKLDSGSENWDSIEMESASNVATRFRCPTLSNSSCFGVHSVFTA